MITHCPHCGEALPTPAEQERADIEADEETPPEVVLHVSEAWLVENQRRLDAFRRLWDTETQD